MFFNMKIEVNEDQPLDEIVKELERLGYKCNHSTIMKQRLIIAFEAGFFGIYSSTKKTDTCPFKLTTLPELKEMKCSN